MKPHKKTRSRNKCLLCDYWHQYKSHLEKHIQYVHYHKLCLKHLLRPTYTWSHLDNTRIISYIGTYVSIQLKLEIWRVFPKICIWVSNTVKIVVGWSMLDPLSMYWRYRAVWTVIFVVRMELTSEQWRKTLWTLPRKCYCGCWLQSL